MSRTPIRDYYINMISSFTVTDTMIGDRKELITGNCRTIERENGRADDFWEQIKHAMNENLLEGIVYGAGL